jgi:hypothetical protein
MRLLILGGTVFTPVGLTRARELDLLTTPSLV